MPLDENSIKIFDEILEYYNWPVHEDDSILEKMEDTNNFNPSNYKTAVSCYRNWCENIYPSMDNEHQEDHKIALAQQTLNILHEHAPKHHIHRALDEC